MSVIVTGNNNYTGTYTDLWVLGGANNGGHDDTDNGSTDVFMFGNLGAGKTLVTDTSYDGTGTLVSAGTYQSTATGTSGDTLHFSFTDHPAVPGATSDFLTSSYLVQGNIQTDPDHDASSGLATLSNTSAINGDYLAWVNSLTGGSYTLISDAVTAAQNAGYGFSDSETIETSAGNPHSNFDSSGVVSHTDSTPVDTDTESYWTGLVDATAPGTPETLTADHGGAKVALGFSVGSDHIALDNVTSESMFDAFFTVAGSHHTLTNGNTVNDTTITLNGTTVETAWSVDLYGVDLSAQGDAAAQAHYAWTTIVSHPLA